VHFRSGSWRCGVSECVGSRADVSAAQIRDNSLGGAVAPARSSRRPPAPPGARGSVVCGAEPTMMSPPRSPGCAHPTCTPTPPRGRPGDIARSWCWSRTPSLRSLASFGPTVFLLVDSSERGSPFRSSWASSPPSRHLLRVLWVNLLVSPLGVQSSAMTRRGAGAALPAAIRPYARRVYAASPSCRLGAAAGTIGECRTGCCSRRGQLRIRTQLARSRLLSSSCRS